MATKTSTSTKTWPPKKLADALKNDNFWSIALEGINDLSTHCGIDAFDAAEKVAAAVVFKLMAEDEDGLGLFNDDVHEAVRFLWRKSRVTKSLPTEDQLADAFAWAEANYANTHAIIAQCDIIKDARNQSSFRVKDDGLFFDCQDRHGNPVRAQVTLTRIEVLAMTRERACENWGRLVEVTDPDGHKRQVAICADLLAGRGDDARKMLMRMGLIPASNSKADELLIKYLRQIVDDRARCVPRPGWNPAGDRPLGVYVTPMGEAINVGDVAELVVLQSDQPPSPIYGQAGTLEGWKDAIGRLCVDNSRLVLAVSAALAAPLLTPVGLEGGGLHFFGPSSTGKTTALHVAGSVCGGGGVSGYVRSWKTTGNGLEATAAEANDNLLCLDELAQVDPKDLAEAAYALSNGQGKARANRDGTGRRPAQWRLLFLSTGEITLEAKIAEDPRAGRSKAGQAVRCVEIPADAGAGHGLFEVLHGSPDGDAFARRIKDATKRTYGTALPAFMAKLVTEHYDEHLGYVRQKIRSFEELNAPIGADGQVSRVASRFGLLAAAGELGTELGVLPWPKGEATKAAKTCFSAWMAQRGGSGPMEIDKGIEQVKAFLLRFGQSRFQRVSVNLDSIVAPKDLAGFRDGDQDGQTFFVFPAVWRDEICAGFDANAIARALAQDGKVKLPGDGKKITRAKRLPKMGVTPVVYILPALLADGGKDEDEAQAQDEDGNENCNPCNPAADGSLDEWVTELEQ